MRNFYTILICFVTAWLNWTVFIMAAHAETCVGGGALSITGLPGTMNFNSLNGSVNSLTNTVTYSGSLSFSDLRNTSAGFNIDVTATNFATQSGVETTFSMTNLSITPDSGDIVNHFECDPVTGISLSSTNPSAFTDSDNTGPSDEKTIVTGDVRVRIGKYFIYPVLDLTVPGGTPPGTYRTTLTYTIY